MEALLALWKREPARIVGFTVAVLAILVAFGVQITTNQQEAIVGIVVAVIALLGGEVTRSQVYSPATHAESISTAFNAGHAEGVDTAGLRAGDVALSDNLASATGRAILTPRAP